MHKAVKVLLIFIGAIIFIMFMGILSLVSLVDPNKYKAQISADLSKTMNHQVVKINGEVHWVFFPYPGIKINNLQVDNPASFGSAPFLSIQQITISFKILPLIFSRSIHFAKMNIEHATLNLITNPLGEHNWTFLHSKSVPTTQEKTVLPSVNVSSSDKFNMGYLNIHDSQINWIDQRRQRKLMLDRFNLSVKGVYVNRPLVMNTTFRVFSVHPALNLAATGQTRITINVTQHIFKLNNLIFHFKNQHNMNQASKEKTLDNDNILINAKSIQYNGIRNQFEILDLNLRNEMIHLLGSATVSSWSQKPQIIGKVHLWMNAKKVLENGGYKVIPPTTLPAYSVFNQVTGLARFQGDSQALNISGIRGHLDQTFFQGDALVDWKTPHLTFKLQLSKLNLDKYIQTKITPSNLSESSSVMDSEKILLGVMIAPFKSIFHPSDDGQSQPQPQLKQLSQHESSSTLNIEGQLLVNQLTFNDINFMQFTTHINLNNHFGTLNPFNAKVGEGNIEGHLNFNYAHSPVEYTIHSVFKNVKIGTLLKNKIMDGVGDISSDLMVKGNTLQQKLKNLNGTVNLIISNGTLKKINFSEIVQHALKTFHDNIAVKNAANTQTHNTEFSASKSAHENTHFSKLVASASINQGLMTIHHVQMTAPFFIANGSGNININNEKLNFDLNFIPQDPGHFIKIKNLVIPVLITGTFEKPIIQPDYSKLKTNENSQNVEIKVQKVLDQQKNKKLRKVLGRKLEQYLGS